MAGSGRFCWMDLAASDAGAAAAFYGRLFGWAAQQEPANGGSFTRLRLSGIDVGSLYQLGRAQLESGVSSHWTPYVGVENLHEAAERAVSLGGEIIVRPFAVADFARIALIVDSVGAPLGLWEHGR